MKSGNSPASRTTRVTLDLTEEGNAELELLVTRLGVTTKAAALRKAIRLCLILASRVDKDGMVRVGDTNLLLK